MNRKYSPELRERALRMLAELRPEHPTTMSAVRHVAGLLWMSPETWRLWQRRYEVDARHAPPIGSVVLSQNLRLVLGGETTSFGSVSPRGHASIIDGDVGQRHGHKVSRFSPRAEGRNLEVVSHLSRTHRVAADIPIEMTVKPIKDVRPRSVVDAIQGELDGKPVGVLSPTSTANLAPLVRHVLDHGVVPVSRASLRGNTLKADITLRVAGAQYVDPSWIESIGPARQIRACCMNRCHLIRGHSVPRHLARPDRQM